jgi:hypothetical protein
MFLYAYAGVDVGVHVCVWLYPTSVSLIIARVSWFKLNGSDASPFPHELWSHVAFM